MYLLWIIELFISQNFIINEVNTKRFDGSLDIIFTTQHKIYGQPLFVKR